MSAFMINVESCEVLRGEERLVTAELLQQSVELQDMEKQVKRRIQVALQQAHEQREQARAESEQLLQQAEIQAQENLQLWQQQAQESVMSEMVQWVKDETEFTEQLLQELQPKIAEQIQRVITQWAGEQESSTLIAQRLTEEVVEKVGEGVLTLSVAADDESKLTELLNDKFTIKVDPHLASGCAELHSKALTARIDVEQHLATLLEIFISKPATDEHEILAIGEEAQSQENEAPIEP
ncbi:type III secretion protein [Parashewanella curva]|uniref:Type III secretion protein n=1 Tax=Parashewanella curva TaxID=2338552 RepID=A0A3L8PWT7_9GAMM|nr:type III secretion protein [Parashewanella curva]RLV59780.1 type III secretion protein [Parashewanella curva]